MKKLLITISNHVYSFDIEVEKSAISNVVIEYLSRDNIAGLSVIAACDLIYDVDNRTSIKSRYDDQVDLTSEAIRILLSTAKFISVQNLKEAYNKAYPSI